MTTAEPRSTRRAVTAVRIQRVRGDRTSERRDDVATEEPMEIRVHGPGQEPIAVAVTMRTPGADFELAVGFLLTEGVVATPGDVARIAYCSDAEQEFNIVTIALATAIDTSTLARNVFATSSCGICGKATLDAVDVACAPIGAGPLVHPDTIRALPQRMREAQRVFAATGGLHAAALFDPDGTLGVVREDVGRHNAVDKVIGHRLLADRPFSDALMMVSGRLSFEIVQKAAVAGIPIVCAVSAPSSLAVAAAERLGVTVVGFLREDGFNVYAHPDRVVGLTDGDG